LGNATHDEAVGALKKAGKVVELEGIFLLFCMLHYPRFAFKK